MPASAWSRRRFLGYGAAATAQIASPALARTKTAFAVIAPSDISHLARRASSAAGMRVARESEALIAHVPQPMARIHIEGTLPGQGIYDQSMQAMKDFPAALKLALGAAVTGDPSRAEAAARILQAWSDLYKPNFNPIDETTLDQLVFAWDLIVGIRAPLQGPVIGLWRLMAEGYARSPRGWNNWNSHRVKLMTLCGYATGQPRLIRAAREAFRAQILNNIRDDGEVLDFKQRDAISYVVYGLQPLLVAAYAARRHGQDWWSLEGGQLSRAVAWLRPYADGSRAHEEFANTTVAFDVTRRRAGLRGYSGPFDPRRAGGVMALAARFDRRYQPLAFSIPWLDLLDPL